jgi:hypothetical protein
MRGDSQQGRVMAIPPEERKHFEGLGEAQVRLQFGAIGFSYPRQNYARIWLAEIDEDRLAHNEALQTKQMRLAQSASRAAWIAAYAAIGAVIVTVLGTVVTILAWVFPRN